MYCSGTDTLATVTPISEQFGMIVRLSSSFITPLAAYNKKTHNTYKIHKNKDKKSYIVTVPAKTLHTALYNVIYVVDRASPILAAICSGVSKCGFKKTVSCKPHSFYCHLTANVPRTASRSVTCKLQLNISLTSGL